MYIDIPNKIHFNFESISKKGYLKTPVTNKILEIEKNHQTFS